MATEKSIIAKLAPAVFLPKRIQGQPEAVRSLVLGTLVGLADDFKMGKAANGDSFRGYAGSFEFIDAQEVARPVQQSGVLYLPSGVDDMMAAAVEEAVKTSGQVQIAMEVSVVRAGNPNGYSWQFRNLVDNVAVDPLDELRKLAASKASTNLVSEEKTDADRIAADKPAAITDETPAEAEKGDGKKPGK